MAASSVLLPQPDGPTKATSSPRPTSRLTSWTASTSSNVIETPRTATCTPSVGDAPAATDERLRAIEQLAEQVNGYVPFIRRIAGLQGSSDEAKEKAVAAFHARLTTLERHLGRICEDVQLG